MLRHVAGFELRYQATTPIFWITSLIFFGLTFWWVLSDTLRVGWGGYVVRNSPYAVAQMGMIMGVFAIFILTTFVSNVILRDDETRFSPIIRTTSLSKFDYLFGRFLGAFGASCLVFLSVPIGAISAAAMPWLDPATVGAFRVEAYLYTYFVLCMPTLFILGAGLFALATTTRSMLSTYVAAIVLLMVYLLSQRYLNQPDVQATAALLDPFGLSAFKVLTQYWSPTERNAQLAPLTGVLLENRLLWLAVAGALLAWTWRVFSRAGATGQSPQAARKAASAAVTVDEPSPLLKAGATRAPATRSLGWAPLVALTRFDVMSVLRSPVFLVLLAIALGNNLIVLWFAGDDLVSITLPVTRILVNALAEELGMIPLAIAAFYAGELVWRDRERRMHDIVGATPAADWVFVVPKIIAIAIVLLMMVVLSAVAAIGVQALKGFYHFEFAKYATWYLLPWLVTMAQFAVLAVFIQVLVPNKYSGLLVVLLLLAAKIALPKLGWEDHLYLFGSTSPVPLSDMNGQGEFARYAAWYRLYWTGAAAILALLAYGLWRRGGTATLGQRLRQLPSRLTGRSAWLLAGAAVVMVGAGGVVVYNTRVLNEWRTAMDSERWSAEYERQLFAYKSLTPPRITDVALDIDIETDVPRVTTRGRFVVENKTAEPLSDIPVFWARQLERGGWLGADAVPDLQLRALEVAGATLVKEIPDLHFRIYRFDSPLQPGQTAEIRFETVREQRGFRNGGNENRVVENGTFLASWEITPILGVHNLYALQDRTARRRYGLSDELRPPQLDDQGPRGNHYFRPDSDWVNAEITVSAAADQIVVAPGERVADDVDGARRKVHFKTTAPIHHFFTVLSARYAERRETWNDVALEIYHHPDHVYNVERMMRAMKASLEYYSTHFSPYQFKHLRIAEFPAYRNFAQAYPGTIAYSEAAGFILGDPQGKRHDGVTRVTAHEVAHQWWAHQVIGADMQGQTVLTETLAEYSALMVMEQMYGPSEIHGFLRWSLDYYLRARGSDITGEVPLEQVEEQAHIRYTKGGMVMYLLKDLMGEEAVNRALRSLIEDYAFKGPPYPTSRDLTRRLREQASPELQPLIADLFEKITTYDFKVVQAKATPRPDGKWDVAVEIDARKHYADGKGVQAEAPLETVIDVGVFAVQPGAPDFTADSVYFLQHQPVRSGRQTLNLVVDREPKFVGADPYSKYIDSTPADNVLAVVRE
ncbi:MAG TPA: M1 family aminopeptidase [Solimonas sp.]